MAIPIARTSTQALHLLAHIPRHKELVTHGLAPLVRAAVQHDSDLPTGTGNAVSRQWLLTNSTHIIASSHQLRRRRPDLRLDNGTPLERTFPTATVKLEHLEKALLLEPNPDNVTIDLNAVARGRHGDHQVTLTLQVTPIKLNATNYAFLAHPSSAEGETLQELGDSAILHTTMHQIGMFLVLDRFGTIHSATDSLTDNLGYEPLAVKDLNITNLLEKPSITRFNTLRENTLALLHHPGAKTRIPNPERVPITLQARDGTPREFTLNLILLRTRIEGETIPRGFVAVINLTDSHMLLHQELTERLRYVRHDRLSSANAIAALVEEIRRVPNLTKNKLNQHLTDIHDEARVWSEITDTHAQLLDAITTPNAPKPTHDDLLLALNDIVNDQAPRYIRFYARHKLNRAERERITLRIENCLEGVTAWAHDDGRLTLYYALRNLIENAVKYTVPEPDGERAITIAITPDPEQPDYVRVEITNATTGLDETAIGQAWDYKRRLANAANHTRGTGIGLWSTKQLIERAGGQVGAYLHDNSHRVSFYLSFPLVAFNNLSGQRTIVRHIDNGKLEPVRPEDVHSLVRFATNPPGTPPKVLILDPDPDDLNLTTHYFTNISAHVTPARTTDEAKQALTNNAYDLFLTEHDPTQPRKTEALMRLARRAGATARVLTSTPSATPETLLTASSAPKPIYKDGLTPIIAVNLAYGGREDYGLQGRP